MTNVTLPQNTDHLDQANLGLWANSGQLPIFINQVLLEHRHDYLLTWSKASFTLQRQSWVNVMQVILPTKPELATVRALTEPVLDPVAFFGGRLWVLVFQLWFPEGVLDPKLPEFLSRDISEKNFRYVLDWN